MSTVSKFVLLLEKKFTLFRTSARLFYSLKKKELLTALMCILHKTKLEKPATYD